MSKGTLRCDPCRDMRHNAHHQSGSGKPISSRRPLIGADLERCLFCAGTAIIKVGKRYKSHEILQRWYCHQCRVSFTKRTASKGSVYPLAAILEALVTFYQGHTADHTIAAVSKRFGLSLHLRTLSRWLAEHRDLTTYARLRAPGKALYTPHQLIRSTRLHHKQVYTYRMHRGKLDLLLNQQKHQSSKPIAGYLTDMAEQCPHHLFQTDRRASSTGSTFDLTAVEIKATHNHACRIAHLALQAVTNNSAATTNSSASCSSRILSKPGHDLLYTSSDLTLLGKTIFKQPNYQFGPINAILPGKIQPA